MRLVTQQAAVDGEGGHVALVVVDHDEALARHRDVLGRLELVGRFERAKQVAERCMNQHGTV